MDSLYFATSNKNKFEEAKEILERFGIALRWYRFSHQEIRSDSLDRIAADAVRSAYKKIKKPVFVEDSGLFIDALNGFPGPYSLWVLQKLGVGGILRLLNGENKRSAHFQASIAFHDIKMIKIFVGVCKGSIAKKERGKGGFGYDSIFVPEGYSHTFAENIQLKNKLSHRYKSLLKLAHYLKNR